MTDETPRTVCGKCARKRHTQCAPTVACDCRDFGHYGWDAPARTYARTHANLADDVWTDDDARTMLGDRGARASVTADGNMRAYGFAWSARCGHMHYARPVGTERIVRHNHAPMDWPMRVADVTADVRTTGRARSRCVPTRASVRSRVRPRTYRPTRLRRAHRATVWSARTIRAPHYLRARLTRSHAATYGARATQTTMRGRVRPTNA
jgi:hypothetical protein